MSSNNRNDDPGSDIKGRSLLHFAVIIDPARVYFLKFILEGYDNLYAVTTLDRANGTVLVRAAEGSGEELRRILDALRDQIDLQCLEDV